MRAPPEKPVTHILDDQPLPFCAFMRLTERSGACSIARGVSVKEVRTMWRRTLVPSAFMVLVAAIAMASALPGAFGLRVSPALAASRTEAAHNCQNIQLTVSTQGSQGAAGTIVVIYRFHNLSAQACTLYGYSGVQLMDGHFLTIHTIVHRGLPVGRPIPIGLVRLGAHGNAY